MLILTRRIGEKIIIGDNTTLTVVSIDAFGRVTLGFDAPRDVRIDREEIRNKGDRNAGPIFSNHGING